LKSLGRCSDAGAITQDPRPGKLPRYVPGGSFER
jgi:hypothetical protein